MILCYVREILGLERFLENKTVKIIKIHTKHTHTKHTHTKHTHKNTSVARTKKRQYQLLRGPE